MVAAMSSVTTRAETIALPDGECAAHIAIPAAGRGPGMLLLHEIFGVNVYVRDAATRLADAGYVVLAPDLFWRTQPGLELPHTDAGTAAGMQAAQQLDFPAAVGDAIAAMALMRSMPEVNGEHVGVIGFCLGGTFAYQVAVHGTPDVAVMYYGSGIPGELDAASEIRCPTIMHWGGADPFIPRDQVDAVAARAADHPCIECHVHEDAGHAFDNHRAPQFHHPAAAAAAWELTSAFLARELPVLPG